MNSAVWHRALARLRSTEAGSVPGSNLEANIIERLQQLMDEAVDFELRYFDYAGGCVPAGLLDPDDDDDNEVWDDALMDVVKQWLN